MTIEEYLAELRRHLRAGPLTRHRILREVEAHLADAAKREEENGFAREQAEGRAVRRFGLPDAVAARFSPGPSRRQAALVLAGAALMIGLAGALSYAFTRPTDRTIVLHGYPVSIGTSYHVTFEAGRPTQVHRGRSLLTDGEGSTHPLPAGYMVVTKAMTENSETVVIMKSPRRIDHLWSR
jgi:hypothetical protein